MGQLCESNPFRKQLNARGEWMYHCDTPDMKQARRSSMSIKLGAKEETIHHVGRLWTVLGDVQLRAIKKLLEHQPRMRR